MKGSVVCALTALLLFAASYSSHATGALYVRPLNSTQTYTAMSIKTYDATVAIQDQIAVTHVDQRFFNKTVQRVEATFIFPLPEGAVITELIYWFNGRQYRASLREKQEAQQAYNEQIRKLIDPALLQDIGDNVFKLNIAPIDPNSEVRFEITYAELLNYQFGRVEYLFPLNTTGLSPEPLERVSVRIDATTNRTFKTFSSPSHGSTTAGKIDSLAPNGYRMTFGDELFTPDQDLVIRFETRRQGVDMNVLTYVPTPADSFGVDKFYALWVTPPDTIEAGELPGRHIVFTADISSSMEGKRIEQLKRALGIFLEALQPNDRFNIVVFSTNVIEYRPDLVRADAEQIAGARKFVDELGAIGLTNIDAALRRSFRMSFADTGVNAIIFMTDGYPTWGELNPTAIVDSVAGYNGHGVRLFTFGIGEELSKPLLEHLAVKNGGYATYISSDDSIASTIENYFRRVSSPALSDLRLDYGGLQSYDMYPSPLPDLFWGAQLVQFGRYKGSGVYTITLTGDYIGKPFTLTSTADFGDIPGGNRAVARLWAKQKIDDLLRQIKTYGEQKELVDAVIDLSIRFGILTPYTAFYVDPNKDPALTDAPTDDVLTARRPTLIENYPNPFHANTWVRFSIPSEYASHRMTISVFDLEGRRVRTLFDGNAEAGNHDVTWDGADGAGARLPAGTYVIRLQIGDEILTRVVVFLG